MTGEWPPRSVSYRDNDPANLRWANLRLASPRQTAHSRKARNKLGVKGVREAPERQFPRIDPRQRSHSQPGHLHHQGGAAEDTFNNQDDADAFAADALAWHQELGKTSHRSADNLMLALCRVLSFAKEKRRIKYHPIPSFDRLYKSSRADKTWSPELQQQFISTARPAMATAMVLVRNTAMRAKDIREFAWTRYDGQRVQIRSSKTGKWLWIPATRELRAHLDGLTRTGALVMLTPSGRAYTRRYFNEHRREDTDAVGAGDLNFHDNRGTAATLLAEAGAAAPGICGQGPARD